MWWWWWWGRGSIFSAPLKWLKIWPTRGWLQHLKILEKSAPTAWLESGTERWGQRVTIKKSVTTVPWMQIHPLWYLPWTCWLTYLRPQRNGLLPRLPSSNTKSPSAPGICVYIIVISGYLGTFKNCFVWCFIVDGLFFFSFFLLSWCNIVFGFMLHLLIGVDRKSVFV